MDIQELKRATKEIGIGTDPERMQIVLSLRMLTQLESQNNYVEKYVETERKNERLKNLNEMLKQSFDMEKKLTKELEKMQEDDKNKIERLEMHVESLKHGLETVKKKMFTWDDDESDVIKNIIDETLKKLEL